MQKPLSFFEQFGIGVRTYGKAISFVFEKGLWLYFIYALVIAGLLMVGSIYFFSGFAESLETYILSLFGFMEDDTFSNFMTGIIHVLLSIGLKILFFFLFSSVSKYILLIVMSPVMALLSERTEEILTGTVYPFQFGQFIKDIGRGVLIALRNMFIELTFIFVGFLLIWIPVIGWAFGLFLLLLSYYFYGFSMIDYVSERRRMGVSKSVSYVRKHKGLAIGNGFIFSLLFAIPLIGGMIAAVLAPVAACIAVLEVDKKEAVHA